MIRALVFPGQGAQYIGMGKEFYDNFPIARDTFHEVDEALSQNLSQLIFSGDETELTKTSNTQPALMVVSIAILKVLLDQSNKQIGNLAKFVLGHSLGEYTALCAAGSISISDTAKLLRIRGEAMQKACPAGVGAMAAVLGVEGEELYRWCKELAQGEALELANDNAPGQIVVSGHYKAVERLVEFVGTQGKRAVLLKVSAPFHSSLMQPAAEVMKDALGSVEISAPAVPLIANVTARPTVDAEEIRANLVAQVAGKVRWCESVTYLVAEQGVEHQLEIGAGKVLSGLAKRINRDLKTSHIEKLADLDEVMAGL